MRTEQKKKKINYANAWQTAREIVWQARWRLALGAFLMLISRLAGLVLPASTKYLIDEVLVKQNYVWLKYIAAAVGISTLIQASTGFALTQILGIEAQRAITEMRKKVQSHIARLPISFYDSAKTGQLISRIMTDADGIRNLVGTGLVQLTGSIVTALVALGVLFYVNWRMTLITIIVLAGFGAALAYAFKRLRPLFRKRGEITAEVQGRLGESLGGARIVKAYTAEKREEISFARGAHKLFRNVAQSMTGVSTISAFSSLVIGTISVVMITIGGNAVAGGSMTLGDLIMYIFFTGLMAFPIVELSSIGTQITEAFAGLDRIGEILEKPTEDALDAERNALKDIAGRIEFENVWFEYESNLPVIRGVSFTAEAGTTTALVGSSGSGKSTILSLVLNFIQPTRGRITIDGKDLNDVKLRDYRTFLGVVLQDNFLFDGTIAENIAFSKPSATEAEIRQAAKIANADEFIGNFPEGYQTVVGERGVKVSGGQRQRLAIARALLADPQILILDEATSSLDSESEALIQEGLNKLRAGRTTFVIAHRLSTIRSSDQILVIENGEIAERGSHETLLALNGRYRRLYDKQYLFEKNLFVNPGEQLETR